MRQLPRLMQQNGHQMHKRRGLITRTRTQTKKVGKSESESPAIAEAAAAAVAIVVDGAVAIVNPTLVVAVMKRLKISRANLVAASCQILLDGPGPFPLFACR